MGLVRGHAHPPIIDEATFRLAADVLAARSDGPPVHRPHRSKDDYVLRGMLYRGVCGRKMQGHWANAAPYYRCRFPAEYALANKISDPRNVTLRQGALLGPLNEWLAGKFEPRYLPASIDELVAAAAICEPPPLLPATSRASLPTVTGALPSTGLRWTPELTRPVSPAGLPRPRPSGPGSCFGPARTRQSRR
ncbi:MAG TPA: zinc ribbon domain-containing protein [Streptosporangiaceae bacterium]